MQTDRTRAIIHGSWRRASFTLSASRICGRLCRSSVRHAATCVHVGCVTDLCARAQEFMSQRCESCSYVFTTRPTCTAPLCAGVALKGREFPTASSCKRKRNTQGHNMWRTQNNAEPIGLCTHTHTHTHTHVCTHTHTPRRTQFE